MRSALSIRLSRFRKPCPSSGKITYSTGTPFARTASTISSLSTWSTRGSLAPWTTKSGRTMFSAWNSGEMAVRRSSSVSGSPSSA